MQLFKRVYPCPPHPSQIHAVYTEIKLPSSSGKENRAQRRPGIDIKMCVRDESSLEFSYATIREDHKRDGDDKDGKSDELGRFVRGWGRWGRRWKVEVRVRVSMKKSKRKEESKW